MSSPRCAKLSVLYPYSTPEELSGWLGNLAVDVANGAISGFNLSTREQGGVKRIMGEVTVVIPLDHLSTAVEVPS